MDHQPARPIVGKIEKVEALKEQGATQGERLAATAALDRMRANLPVRITATVVDIDYGETFYDVAFDDIEGQNRTIRIRREIFQRPSQVVEQLVKAGADLPDDGKVARNQIKSAVDLKANAVYRITRRPGWYDNGSFVYYGVTFGKLANKLVFEPPQELDPALGLSNGTLEQWREGLREPCKFSDYLVLTISHKASNPLLELIGQTEGVIFHLHGTDDGTIEKTASSMGKSLATRAAASTSGRCRKNDAITFAVTERAICDHCYSHNHLGIELDEEGRSLGSGTGPRMKAEEISYLVSSGRGSVRADRATRDRDLKNRTWTTNAITSGEVPLDATSKRLQRSEGSQVRMIGHPIPAGAKGGIFNRVKGGRKARLAQCQQLASQVEDTIAENYGVLFPAYLAALVENRERLTSKVRKLVAKFVDSECVNGTPWERRFVFPFAIDYAAAVLLADLGLAPWTKKRAYKALRGCYRAARAATATFKEISQTLKNKVRMRLSRGWFPALKKGRALSRGEKRLARRGFQKDLPDTGQTLLVPIAQVQKLIGSAAMVGPVVRCLAKEGVVHLGEGDKVTRQVLVRGLSEERRRYICFNIKSLGLAVR
jgi:Domain of unknown function (DUF927)